MKLAKEEKDKMIQEFRDAIKNWTDPKGPRTDLEKAYTSDRKALRKGLSLFRQGKYKEASSHLFMLDTIVRDQIPQSVYDFLGD